MTGNRFRASFRSACFWARPQRKTAARSEYTLVEITRLNVVWNRVEELRRLLPTGDK
jgi:hypothetical protein